MNRGLSPERGGDGIDKTPTRGYKDIMMEKQRLEQAEEEARQARLAAEALALKATQDADKPAAKRRKRWDDGAGVSSEVRKLEMSANRTLPPTPTSFVSL